MHIVYRLTRGSRFTINSIYQTLRVTTSSVSARIELKLSFMHKINIFVKKCFRKLTIVWLQVRCMIRLRIT
jgi:hypothetical protein